MLNDETAGSCRDNKCQVVGIPGYEKVIGRLRYLCSRREYCSSDILKKAEDGILKYHCDRECASRGASVILASLIEDKYVDDLRYASAFAREKSAIAGWGAVKIRYSLSLKGIDSDIIGQALDEIDICAADSRLVKLIARKSESLENDPQRRLKLIRFGMGRGYSYDMVLKAIASLKEPER